MIEKSKRIWQNGIKGKDLQMAYENDILTRNDNDELAVRTVQSTGDNPASSYDDVYTRDDNGKLAVRVVGGGGGDVDTTKVVNKASVLPTAGSSNLGKVYMYSGETDTNYTHGYIYECQVTTAYEDTTTFQPATISGTVVTATSGAVADLCSEYITGDITEIVSGTMTYDNTGALWVFVGKDSENNTVGTFQIYQSDYEEEGFTFTGTPEDGDVVSFETEITTSSTYSWVRLDVQPAGGSDEHNLGWYATQSALEEAHPTAEDGDWAIVGSTDTVWVWDSDTTAWKDSGVQPTNDYEDLSNKPQINGVTLSGNKTSDDLGIKDTVQISVAGTTTVEGYSVPNPTDEEVTAIYNAVVAGNSVQVVDVNDVYYQVLQVDSVDGAINIELLHFGELSLLYTLENDTVTVTGKKIGGSGLPDPTGHSGQFLTTDGTDASWAAVNALQNTATGTNSLTIAGTGSWDRESVNIGYNSQTREGGISIGYNAKVTSVGAVAIGQGALSTGGVSVGYSTQATKIGSVAIGYNVASTGKHAIQLGCYADNPFYQTVNSEENTFKVGLGMGTNYKLLDSDGTIPTARLTKVNDTITLTAAGWSNGSQTVTVTGMTATGVVLVSPDPTDQSAYTSAGIIATSQSTDSITFTATSTPSADIDVNIVML